MSSKPRKVSFIAQLRESGHALARFADQPFKYLRDIDLPVVLGAELLRCCKRQAGVQHIMGLLAVGLTEQQLDQRRVLFKQFGQYFVKDGFQIAQVLYTFLLRGAVDKGLRTVVEEELHHVESTYEPPFRIYLLIFIISPCFCNHSCTA